MKKIGVLLIFLLLFSFFVSFTPNKAFAKPSDNFVFATVKKVEKMISNAISPLQTAINNLTSRTETLENQVSDLQEKVNNLEDRVSKLEITPTPIATLTPTPTPPLEPVTIVFLDNQPIETVTKILPLGYKSITFNIMFSQYIYNWAPQVSLDNGATYLEQHRFSCGSTCAQVTIPLLSNRIRWSPGTSSGNITVTATLNPELDSEILQLGYGVNFPLTSSTFDTGGFSSITITAGGGTGLQAISLQRLENGTFVEKQKLNCDGGAVCPLQGLPVLGGTYRIEVTGSGTNAVLGAILRK